MADHADTHHRGLASSRYHGQRTVRVVTAQGRSITALALRILPATSGAPYTVVEHDRLDRIAQRAYGDGTRFWHVADANTELEANRLIEPGRTIVLPGTE
jgi:nucleoid-associated protein YgaU